MPMSLREISSEDANKRAIEDYSQSSQYVRSAAQFSFAGNGGAAAAMLSFLTAITTSANRNPVVDVTLIINGFVLSSAFFMAGLFLSVSSMYFFSISKRFWGHVWEDTALVGKINFKSHFARRANLFHIVSEIITMGSGICFIAGAFFALSGFIRQWH